MDTKGLRVEIKDAAKGEVSAVFSTFDVVDSDGDVTLPGAFTDGAEVPISAYGHASWQGALPVGKGRIRATDSEAILDGRFFLDTTAGRDTFNALKQLGGLQQWSYGYDAEEAFPGEFDGRQVRFLKRLTVHEASPVLVGAGVGTRTLDMKSAKEREANVTEYKAAIRPHDTDVVVRTWDRNAVVSAIPDDASVSELRSVFAWVDRGGDPESKSSYKFPHHHGPGGPANVRGCLAGIGALNGARGGASIPAEDRQGVWSHLAGHLRDADREPPELSSGPTGSMKLSDQLIEAMVVVSEAIDSAERVVALRAEKGKTLSHVNAETLDWLRDDLRRLGSLIDTPQEELAREYVRFVASLRGE